MEEKIYYVKKLEKPDFSDLSYIYKNLIVHFHHKLTESDPTIYFGQVKEAVNNDLYLEGFALVESFSEKSGLEKQVVFGKEYLGRFPFYESPLTNCVSEKDKIYEFISEVNINSLREIANSRDKRFRVELSE
ncbi:MAG: hypothetical protein KC516_02630 [Nanoarchaeota archaeon]|nr:hypothetical protein [Nanoarchaeota archaeon]